MDSLDPPTPDDGFPREPVTAALVISVVSVIWTVLSASAAITVGVLGNSTALVAFGSVGVVDAVGSIALVHHFRHGLRNDELSDHLEALAHRVVLAGLALVGGAAFVGGVVRLVAHQSNPTGDSTVVLASVSALSLAALSVRKRQIARRVSSRALLSDAHLSGIGATQAVVALAGTIVSRRFGWHSGDAVATAIVGFVAISVAVRTRSTGGGTG